MPPAALPPKPPEPDQTRRIDSATLLGPRGEVFILHQDQVYRLRVTAQGKLILTK
ncbi:MAG TPA: hemin uptake protein HemP [Roseateles sp.]|uniref:hemin uptake protein HemP n=1 Tax=Roseateles sp. TaxID=1971397 RepID=UPI002EDAC915